MLTPRVGISPGCEKTFPALDANTTYYLSFWVGDSIGTSP